MTPAQLQRYLLIEQELAVAQQTVQGIHSGSSHSPIGTVNQNPLTTDPLSRNNDVSTITAGSLLAGVHAMNNAVLNVANHA